MQKDVIIEETNEEMLVRYKITNDLSLKRELTTRYIYLVKIIAKQMKGVYQSFTEMDDMINEGIIALMEAFDNFDETKNVKFETYASLRVRGTIIDVARKQDWVPRNIRKAVKEIDKAISILCSELERYPTDDEIANHLQIPTEKYLKLLGESSLCNIISLNELMLMANSEAEFEVKTTSDFYNTPDYNIYKKETNKYIKEALDTLKENEKLVISLYYSDEINMKEIAKILNLSESRVSQIHSKALLKLKHKLKIYIEG